MIELTPWILVLLAVGGIVVAIGGAIGAMALYSHITGNPINLRWGPLTVRINDE